MIPGDETQLGSELYIMKKEMICTFMHTDLLPPTHFLHPEVGIKRAAVQIIYLVAFFWPETQGKEKFQIFGGPDL